MGPDVRWLRRGLLTLCVPAVRFAVGEIERDGARAWLWCVCHCCVELVDWLLRSTVLNWWLAVIIVVDARDSLTLTRLSLNFSNHGQQQLSAATATATHPHPRHGGPLQRRSRSPQLPTLLSWNDVSTSVVRVGVRVAVPVPVSGPVPGPVPGGDTGGRANRPTGVDEAKEDKEEEKGVGGWSGR
jgi:hypothetical protein